MSDLMNFLLDDSISGEEAQHETWNVLIVDDDPSIHEATKYVLSDFTFKGKKINWLEAYSAEEAKYIVHQNRDIAIMFLDVVMETDNAGLNFVKWFRESKINPSTRIILRTGQPGQAPEPEIILNYDLHDYKTKTELSSSKLFTTTVSALRAYDDMSRLEYIRDGLENVINASVVLFQIQAMNDFASNILQQFKTVLDLDCDGTICVQNKKDGTWHVLASTALYTDEPDYVQIENLIHEQELHWDKEPPQPRTFIVKTLYETSTEAYIIYFDQIPPLSDIKEKMLKMLFANISIGLSNIILYHELLKAHKSIVMSLAQITEGRDGDTGKHVFRIALGTELLAKELHKRKIYESEIDEKMIDMIGLSSTLHDIGKISVPDDILLKPGKLNDSEFARVKEHSEKGAEILQSVMDYNKSNLQYIELGKQIAMYHHERWNGTGYPYGLKEDQIPVAARITSIIDVFDALINTRCYKKALPVDECLQIIKDGKAIFFDPTISEVFFEVFDSLYEKIWKGNEHA
ncbi:MAG: DUF3369 domain-containing protein [Clostridiales bacterium]|jgi:response regulator RpfG family c-di-GMP phosphodiesterase|nr:DUF3369 domain-containing protein [Clostridiales bacterium]